MIKFSTILIIDTSHPIVWAALVKDGEIITEKEWEGDRTLGVKLLEVVEELLATSPNPSLLRRGTSPALDRIAVHRGPGHFMATRTGVVTAQVLAQATGVPLVAVEGTDRADMIRQAQEGEVVEVVEVLYE